MQPREQEQQNQVFLFMSGTDETRNETHRPDLGTLR